MRKLRKSTFFFCSIVLVSCSTDDPSEELIDLPDQNVQEEDSISPDSDNDSDPLTISSEDMLVLDQTLDLPQAFYNYSNVALPNFFLNNDLGREDNTPNNNLISDAAATLGRVLFYDKKLSANNTVSCASCHLQANSFTDPARFSSGFNGGLTSRNSMSLANAKYYDNGRFFWDERAASLEEQVLMPIQDAVEMGLTLSELEDKLGDEAYYGILFRAAFGDSEVSSNRVALALAQFVRSLVSYQSRFDQGLQGGGNRNNDFANFTGSENRGKDLFFSNRTNCAQCHDTNAFIGDAARNNGLDNVLTDLGVGGVTGNNNEHGEFKVSSLRNIALTAPYMHDGRFASLEEVIEHYNSGVQNSPTLDNRLMQNNGGPRRLNLNEQEKQALLDFLHTLTDTEFLNDEKFSDPFLFNLE